MLCADHEFLIKCNNCRQSFCVGDPEDDGSTDRGCVRLCYANEKRSRLDDFEELKAKWKCPQCWNNPGLYPVSVLPLYGRTGVQSQSISYLASCPTLENPAPHSCRQRVPTRPRDLQITSLDRVVCICATGGSAWDMQTHMWILEYGILASKSV